MQDKTKIDLNSAEVSGLWTTYMSDSMAVCMLKHFLKTLEDEEIRHILERSLNMSNSHLKIVREKFTQDGLPVPIGFTEDDLNESAPKLYTDSFYLFYLLAMAQYGMNNYTLVLNHIARPDMRDFFFIMHP